MASENKRCLNKILYACCLIEQHCQSCCSSLLRLTQGKLVVFPSLPLLSIWLLCVPLLSLNHNQHLGDIHRKAELYCICFHGIVHVCASLPGFWVRLPLAIQPGCALLKWSQGNTIPPVKLFHVSGKACGCWFLGTEHNRLASPCYWPHDRVVTTQTV